MSGLQADARSMIEHARVESQNHTFNYNEPLRVESCTQAICDLALRFGEGADGEESVMSRPFGVALLIAGFDEDGPQLYGGFLLFIRSYVINRRMLMRHADIMPSPRARSTGTTLKLLDRDPKEHRPSYRMNSTKYASPPLFSFSRHFHFPKKIPSNPPPNMLNKRNGSN